MNLTIRCDQNNQLQLYRSHADFRVDEIAEKIEANEHLRIRQTSQLKTKKKRNFIEDLPMDLHILEVKQKENPNEGIVPQLLASKPIEV